MNPKDIAPGHNPAQLSNAQVGAPNWRLLDLDEIVDREKRGGVPGGPFEFWNINHRGYWERGMYYAESRVATYRTRLSRAELRAARGLSPEPLESEVKSCSKTARTARTDADALSTGASIAGIESNPQSPADLHCPLCGEIGFDAQGLRAHLSGEYKWAPRCECLNSEVSLMQAERDAARQRIGELEHAFSELHASKNTAVNKWYSRLTIAEKERDALKAELAKAWLNQEVRDKILQPANCGVSGHFRFQENGGNCMMCSRERNNLLDAKTELEIDGLPKAVRQLQQELASVRAHSETCSLSELAGLPKESIRSIHQCDADACVNRLRELAEEVAKLKQQRNEEIRRKFSYKDELDRRASKLASVRAGSVQLADDLDACKRERDHERKLREDSCKDWAGDDEAIRMICSRAGIDTEGSSYGVPPMVGWVELLHKKHDELQQQLTEQSALCERVVERFKLIAEGREHFHATYNGGHHMPDANAAFHHGMDTVFNWLSVEYVKLLQRAEGKP